MLTYACTREGETRDRRHPRRQGAALDKIAAAAALDDIVRLDQDALGRRGSLIGLKSSLGALSSPEERKEAGGRSTQPSRR